MTEFELLRAVFLGLFVLLGVVVSALVLPNLLRPPSDLMGEIIKEFSKRRPHD